MEYVENSELATIDEATNEIVLNVVLWAMVGSREEGSSVDAFTASIKKTIENYAFNNAIREDA